MKYLLLALLLAAMISVKAAPFLVCDEYPFQTEIGLNVASFTIGGLPGSPIIVPATIDSTSQGQFLHYDLANVVLQNGQSYTITAYATNTYGSAGAPSTVVFTKGVPAAPQHLSISPN